MDIELKSRLMAAYQFSTWVLGDRVSLADIRLHLVNVEPHRLNPLLRELNGTVVEFWGVDEVRSQTGHLSLLESDQSALWSELDAGVEIDGTIYTHMSVTPND